MVPELPTRRSASVVIFHGGNDGLAEEAAGA